MLTAEQKGEDILGNPLFTAPKHVVKHNKRLKYDPAMLTMRHQILVLAMLAWSALAEVDSSIRDSLASSSSDNIPVPTLPVKSESAEDESEGRKSIIDGTYYLAHIHEKYLLNTLTLFLKAVLATFCF